MPVQRAVSHVLRDGLQAHTCFGQLGCMTMPQLWMLAFLPKSIWVVIFYIAAGQQNGF
jgi:hypothetical protein